MHVLVTKDGATKVAREVRNLDEARQIQQTGFVVELINEDGSVSQLPEAEAPAEVNPPPPAKKKGR